MMTYSPFGEDVAAPAPVAFAASSGFAAAVNRLTLIELKKLQ